MDVPDIVCECLKFCDMDSLINCRLTCHLMNGLIDEPLLWREIIRNNQNLSINLLSYKVGQVRSGNQLGHAMGAELIHFFFPLANISVSDRLELATLGISTIAPLVNMKIQMLQFNGAMPKLGDHIYMAKGLHGSHAIVCKADVPDVFKLPEVSVIVCPYGKTSSVPKIMELHEWIGDVRNRRDMRVLNYSPKDDITTIVDRLTVQANIPTTLRSGCAAFLLTTGKYLDPDTANKLDALITTGCEIELSI